MVDSCEVVCNDGVLVKLQCLVVMFGECCLLQMCFVVDVGNSVVWVVYYFVLYDQCSGCLLGNVYLLIGQERCMCYFSWLCVIMDFVFMGWVIGLVVGIVLVNCCCFVVCLIGDGSYLMNG